MTPLDLAGIIERDADSSMRNALADRRALLGLLRETREALEGMVLQFGYWWESAGGIGTGGMSDLEQAFTVLGWEEPHLLPERCCDEPGCLKEGTMGWPTRPGGTGPNGGYRRTCWDHSDIGKSRAALAEP